jgi:hypothetical protein
MQRQYTIEIHVIRGKDQQETIGIPINFTTTVDQIIRSLVPGDWSEYALYETELYGT